MFIQCLYLSYNYIYFSYVQIFPSITADCKHKSWKGTLHSVLFLLSPRRHKFAPLKSANDTLHLIQPMTTALVVPLFAANFSASRAITFCVPLLAPPIMVNTSGAEGSSFNFGDSVFIMNPFCIFMLFMIAFETFIAIAMSHGVKNPNI